MSAFRLREVGESGGDTTLEPTDTFPTPQPPCGVGSRTETFKGPETPTSRRRRGGGRWVVNVES